MHPWPRQSSPPGPGVGGVLDDPAWFGASMSTAAVGAIAAMNPGQTTLLDVPSQILGLVLLSLSAVTFTLLFVRDFGFRGMGRTLRARMRSPLTGAVVATIPGTLNVIAVASIKLWPWLTTSPAGWWYVAVLAATGTSLGLWLTIEFFVSAFEHAEIEARSVSGVWFLPETVILLGALLFSELARTAPVAAQNLTVVAFGLLGAGGILFAFTASMFINRLVLHAHDPTAEVPAVMIMISPLAVTSMALPAVAQDATLVGGTWTAAVLEMSAVLAAMLWGFGLWWIAAATLIARHAGRSALTDTAADWAFVFPPAAMVLATLTLGRFWESAFVEALAVAMSVIVVAVWCTVFVRSVRIIRRS